jgi:hypothetical protein
MPRISIQHQTTKAIADAFSQIRSFFESDSDIKKLDPKMQITLNDAKLSGQAKGSQFTAEFSVKDGNGGAIIDVQVDLPFMLTPFKGKIQETIEKKLKKYLA